MKPLAQATVLDPAARSLGRTYAEALSGVIEDDTEAARAGEELSALAEIIRHTPGAVDLLSAPTLRREDRLALVERIVGGRVATPVRSLLDVMAVNQRLGLLPAVAEAYEDVLDERAGRVEVVVRSAVALDETQRRTLEENLSADLHARAVVRNIVDASVLGGVVVEVGDRVYDASVAGRLEQWRRRVGRREPAVGMESEE